DDQLRDDAVRERAADHHDTQAEKADLQTQHAAKTRGELAALPRGEDVDEARQRRDPEIAAIAKAEVIAQKKEQVVEIIRSRQRVQTREREITNLELAMRHRKISAMAWRQYHFTASVMAGCSLSNSPAEHQRMS